MEKHRLIRCKHLWVGVSAGCDSMALLVVLKDILDRKYQDVKLSAVHVHHGIRGEAADGDAALVEDLCSGLSVPLTVRHLDIPALAKEHKRSLETEGRIQRYAIFSELCEADAGDDDGFDGKSNGAEDCAVAVAHHMDDQAESIAMHLFRGCGMEGLVGMRPRNGHIIRPFLGVRKEEILRFCEERKIPFRNDATNEDSAYSRNFFRNEVFPLIDRGVNQSPVEALCGLSRRIEEENAYLDRLAAEELEKKQKAEGQVFLAEIEDHPLKLRILKRLAADTFGDLIDIEECHWESILEMLARKEGNKRICLPNDRFAALEQGTVRFYTAEEQLQSRSGALEGIGFLAREEDSSEVLPLRNIPCGEMIKFFQSFVRIKLELIEKDAELVYNSTTWFFPEPVLKTAELRTRRAGDTVSRAGTGVTKDLRRFMNDAKIPAGYRDRLLLVADGNRVLWVPGKLHAVGFTDEKSWKKFREARENARADAMQGEKMYRLELLEEPADE